MKKSQKGFSALSGTMGVAAAGLVVAGGLIYSAGAVRISVHEKRPGGDSIRLIVPAAVVPLAMMFVPDRQLQHLPPEAKQALPALRIAAEELGNVPDGPLVEVHGPGEDVSIVLRDRKLVIDVDSNGDEVHLQIPLGTVESVVSSLVSANET